MLPKPFRSSALAFGSALHSSLAWFHEERLKGNTVTLEKLFQIFDADWYSQRVEVNIHFKESEREMNLLNTGKEMLSLFFQEEHPKVKGSEVQFTVPLHSPSGGPDLEVSLLGFFDLIEEDGTIVEYKTSAIALGGSDIDARLQLTAYSYAYQLLYRKPPKALRVVDFVKGKKPKIVVIDTKRDQQDHVGFLHTAQEVLRSIKAGIFIPRQSFMCKECEYADLCPLMKNKASVAKAETLYAA
jgi:putative RecB family exonuclease